MNTTGTMNTEDSSFIRTSVVWNLSAQEEANCNDENVMLKTGDMTETPAVHHLSALEASCVMTEKISGLTETPAVWNLPAQEASCVMLKGIGGTTEAHTVQHLSAQEASCYSVRGPRYTEPQQHSIKNSSADTEAMNSDASHISISLQIENSASADTVKALQLMFTHSSIGGEITAYIKMSIKQLKHAICTEQLKDSLIQQV